MDKFYRIEKNTALIWSLYCYDTATQKETLLYKNVHAVVFAELKQIVIKQSVVGEPKLAAVIETPIEAPKVKKGRF